MQQNRDVADELGKLIAEMQSQRDKARTIIDKLEVTISVMSSIRLCLLIDQSRPESIVEAVQEMMR